MRQNHSPTMHHTLITIHQTHSPLIHLPPLTPFSFHLKYTQTNNTDPKHRLLKTCRFPNHKPCVPPPPYHHHSPSPPPPPQPPPLFPALYFSIRLSSLFTMSDHSGSSFFSSAVVNRLSPPPVDDSIIDSLISGEPHHSPVSDYLRRSVHLTHRQDSINWILNAHAHYEFQPLTAILSVNYFDRFLSSAGAGGGISFEWNKGWEFQLLSVACLSLAAKLEEPEVPLLLDLQVSEPRFAFEPKTIQKMELWVMERLKWRLRSVTPFDFISYFMFKLPQSSCFDARQFYLICSDLIIKTIRVIDFLGFRPSVIAAATVISAAGEGVEIPEGFYAKVNKEMVRSCHQLIEEYLVDTCPSADHKVRKQWRSDESPASPDGVLDAATCVSCDTRSGDRNLAPATFSGCQDSEDKQVRPIVQEEEQL